MNSNMSNEELVDKVCEEIKEDLLSTDAPLYQMLSLIAETDARKFLVDYLPRESSWKRR